MRPIDQDARDAILADEDNIVVSASAGSGKTTIMVKKMEKVLERIDDHKTIAAVTFTVKATKEIRKKSKNVIEKPFIVKTNDSFIESEVIRPFIQDALGIEFHSDYIVEYDNRYKFADFESGLNQLRENNILGSFTNNHLNFNFQLALYILQRSVAAQEYFKYKYYMLFIDEYQDSDRDMHNFFMWLKNHLNIKLFIVGDSKQAIYIWRGAMRNVFELLEYEDFNMYELITNFRCDKEIENFANLIHNPSYYLQLDENVENAVFKEFPYSGFDNFIEEFNQLVEDNIIDISKEVTIISNFNRDAQYLAETLNEHGYDFVFIPRTPIDEGIPNGNLLKELAMYTKNEKYNIYELITSTQIDERIKTRIDVESIIKPLKRYDSLNDKTISAIVSELGRYLEISITDTEIAKFTESVKNSRYDMAFKILEEKYKVMTVFASKGLEFEQVISFAHYYEIYNNRHLENHYVCITRAISKFIMFINDIDYLEYISKVINNQELNEKKVYNYIVSNSPQETYS